MPTSNSASRQKLFRKEGKGRLGRINIVVAILLAGWVPSILMLVISYTVLTHTLESRILRDRQTFVQLIARLVGDDFNRTGGIVEYYQGRPELAAILASAQPAVQGQEWLDHTYYAHPRIDGMFLAGQDGQLIASIPAIPPEAAVEFPKSGWKLAAPEPSGARVSPVHPRPSDGRMTTDIVGAVSGPAGNVVGYLGVSMLVERMGRRLSSVELADQSTCQLIDQTGTALFTSQLEPNNAQVSKRTRSLLTEIREKKTGHLEYLGNLYSFSLIEPTGWVVAVRQPRAAAYKPVQELLTKITLPVLWLIALTAGVAAFAGRYNRRQAEAARRLEREVVFNEEILANMPSGIALVDPVSRHFLQANEAFARMAKSFGGLDHTTDIRDATHQEVKIAPAEAIDEVLASGTHFQLVEQPFEDRNGETHFVNVSLLRLQGARQQIQGLLYLVEDKTRDVTLRQELINANAAKDQFLALLSHELRNPLSPVIAMVGELEAAAAKSPHIHQALEVIRRNVELEARLIDDLLDVTRISKGKLQLTFETVDVHEILQRAYEICREEILAKNLGMEFRLRAESTHVHGDPARLQQVFWNLIKNSVKFTPARGRITIETSNPSPGRIEIRTTDTGIGIEREKIDKVFNAFEQGQSSITRRFGGLGLGLAISKAMVAAHHGRLTVKSDGKNRGATFALTLATVSAPADGAAAPREKQFCPELDGQRRGEPHPLRLLVVDDHPDTCTGMKMMLERRGYRVSVAHSADEAVAMTRRQKFDLLISDIGLPDRSGYELMEQMRASNSLRGIAVSGFGMEDDICRARAAGFSEHLTKPINFERLEEAIHNLLLGSITPQGNHDRDAA